MSPLPSTDEQAGWDPASFSLFHDDALTRSTFSFLSLVGDRRRANQLWYSFLATVRAQCYHFLATVRAIWGDWCFSFLRTAAQLTTDSILTAWVGQTLSSLLALVVFVVLCA
jgi:hypothetical protein